MKRALLVALLYFVVPQAWSQDLDRLKDRAQGLWAERGKRDAARAKEYVEPSGRSNFPMHELAKGPTVVGLEFTDARTTVLVRTRIKLTVPTIGEADTTVVEPWVWMNGNWFLHVELAESIVTSRTPPTAKPVEFQFDVLDQQLDLGRYKQGEIAKGSVRFAASKALTNQIRGRGIPGLRVEGVQWLDDKGGTITFSVDTSLMSEDISRDIEFAALGPSTGFDSLVKTDKVTVAIHVQGSVRITQTSEPLDLKRNGSVEIEVRNLGDAPISLEKVRSMSPGLEVRIKIPGTIQAGETLKIPIAYTVQRSIGTEELILGFSPGVLPNSSLIFPLRVVDPEPSVAPQGLTLPPDIQEKIRKAQEKPPIQ